MVMLPLTGLDAVDRLVQVQVTVLTALTDSVASLRTAMECLHESIREVRVDVARLQRRLEVIESAIHELATKEVTTS